MNLCSLFCPRSLRCPVNFGFYGMLKPSLPCFFIWAREFMLFHIACGVALRPSPRNFSLLACFDLEFPQYLFTRVCELSFCYLEFIVRAQLCSVIFSSRRAFIPPLPPKKLCNFVLFVTYIYVLYPENSTFKIPFPQQLCLCLCKSMLLIGVDCICCLMQISVLLTVSG